MRQITEKEFNRIKSLEKGFYKGVEEYCEELEDTWSFIYYFEEIMNIILGAKEVKK